MVPGEGPRKIRLNYHKIRHISINYVHTHKIMENLTNIMIIVLNISYLAYIPVIDVISYHMNLQSLIY